MPRSIAMTAANTPSADDGLLDRRRIYVFPTGGGVLFAMITVMVLIGGMNYNNSMAHGLSFLLGGIFLIAIGRTWTNLAGIRCLGVTTEPVFAGETAVFRVCFDNRRGGERLNLELWPYPQQHRWWRRQPEPETSVRFDMPAGELVDVAVRLPARQRGRLVCPRLLLQSTFPVGLVRAWAYVEPDVACTVYPQPGGRLVLPLAAHDRSAGGRPVDAGNDDFAGLRNYQAGDPPRSIAWKVFARSDQLEIKRFAGHGEQSARLRWDMVEQLPSTEARLEQLCRWLLEARRSGVGFGLEIPGRCIEVGAGDIHLGQCLEALAMFNLAPGRREARAGSLFRRIGLRS